MIKANELRIGNWVNGYKTTIGVKPFQVKGENIVHFSKQIVDSVSPIPLSPEILEQRGFEKHDKLNRGNSNAWWKEGMNEYITHHYDGLCIYESTKPRTIKYLHQLQNLYFALTGEELQINIHDNAKRV